MFKKEKLKYLGMNYFFLDYLNKKDIKNWCEQVKKPSKELISFLDKIDIKKEYHRANSLMIRKSLDINELFKKELDSFSNEIHHSKNDEKYFFEFVNAHFSQDKHLRVLISQMIGGLLLDAQNREEGLKDDLKVRKIINKKQLEKWRETLDMLSVAVEIVNVSSYSADDVFDKTEYRYDVPTLYKKYGGFGGIISADILVSHLGNFIFNKTIKKHEEGVEVAYLGEDQNIEISDPYLIKWKDNKTGIFVNITPEQYMDVYEMWNWAWYLINSGQIRDLHEFNISNIDNFSTQRYIYRAYRLTGGLMESIGHLSSAFMGCGYWRGRENIGKWSALYGTMAQIRNDFYDFVTYSVGGHKFIKDTHEDIGMGKTTFAIAHAYKNAKNEDKKEMKRIINSLVEQKNKDLNLSDKDKIKLNTLIAKNGGFIATKKLVYNFVIAALEELIKLKDDFKDNDYYSKMISWTIASLNIINLEPEKTEKTEKIVENIFDVEEVYNYLNEK